MLLGHHHPSFWALPPPLGLTTPWLWLDPETMKTYSERTPEAHPHRDGNDWWNIHTSKSIFLTGIKPCSTGPKLQVRNFVYQLATGSDIWGPVAVSLSKTSRLPAAPFPQPLQVTSLWRRWRYSRQSCLSLLWTFTSTGHIPSIKAFTVRLSSHVCLLHQTGSSLGTDTVSWSLFHPQNFASGLLQTESSLVPLPI